MKAVGSLCPLWNGCFPFNCFLLSAATVILVQLIHSFIKYPINHFLFEKDSMENSLISKSSPTQLWLGFNLKTSETRHVWRISSEVLRFAFGSILCRDYLIHKIIWSYLFIREYLNWRWKIIIGWWDSANGHNHSVWKLHERDRKYMELDLLG